MHHMDLAKAHILIIDDELEMCLSIKEILLDEGYRATFIDDPRELEALLSKEHIDLILMDIRMPGIGGIDLLKSVKRHSPNTPVIMITGYPSVDTAVRAMKYGAVNYFSKPLDLRALIEEIRLVITVNAQPKLQKDGLDQIISNAPKIADMKLFIRKAADVDTPVLITGESGTGKELVAKAIHHYSHRIAQPFVHVNCAAIPDTLIESELFGYEKGAFTDAKKTRIGRFEQANYGTLFLDEVGDLSLAAQAKILQALQERTFERVGGNGSISVDIRIIAATNKNLVQMIKESLFREDLYYRLSVINFDLPPLKDRPGDVRLLTDHFIEEFSSLHHRNIIGASDEVYNLFAHHNWPGNIRELKNCVERAVIFSDGPVIGLLDLPSQYLQINDIDHDEYSDAIDEINREMILDALSKSGGVKIKAAEILNVTRKTLYNRMKRLSM